MWLIAPSTCYPSAPAAAGSIGPSDWRFQLLASSAALNTKHLPPNSWHRAWKRDTTITRLCGRICEPSMASRGVESWIASLRDSRVSHSHAPASALGSMILGIFGRTSIELLRKRSRHSCFSKTSPASSLFDAPMEGQRPSWSSMNWPTLVMKLRRDSLRRLKSARRTFAGDCSSSEWITAQARDHHPCGKHTNGDYNHASLPSQIADWPTPKTPSDGGRSRKVTTRLPGARSLELNEVLRTWPTPTGADGTHDSGLRPDQDGQSLTATDDRKSKNQDRNIAVEAQQWQTVRSHEVGDYQNQVSGPPIQTLTGQSRSFPPAPQTSTDGAKSSHDGRGPNQRRLNYLFVAWLMGWVCPDATGSGFWGMGFALWQARMRSQLLRLVCAKESPECAS